MSGRQSDVDEQEGQGSSIEAGQFARAQGRHSGEAPRNLGRPGLSTSRAPLVFYCRFIITVTASPYTGRLWKLLSTLPTTPLGPPSSWCRIVPPSASGRAR